MRGKSPCFVLHGHHNRQRPSTLGVVLGNAADRGRILNCSGSTSIPALTVLAVKVACFPRLSALTDVSFRIFCLCVSWGGQFATTTSGLVSDSLVGMLPLEPSMVLEKASEEQSCWRDLASSTRERFILGHYCCHRKRCWCTALTVVFDISEASIANLVHVA